MDEMKDAHASVPHKADDNVPPPSGQLQAVAWLVTTQARRRRAAAAASSNPTQQTQIRTAPVFQPRFAFQNFQQCGTTLREIGIRAACGRKRSRDEQQRPGAHVHRLLSARWSVEHTVCVYHTVSDVNKFSRY